VKFLLIFHGAKATGETFRAAISSGNLELIRVIWDALSDEDRVARLRFLETACDFHRVEAVAWLFEKASPRTRESFICFSLRRRLADSLLAIFASGYRPWSDQARSLASSWSASRSLEFDSPPSPSQEPIDGLLSEYSDELESLGLDLSEARLLLSHDAGRWDFAGEFSARVSGVSPTLLLVSMSNSFVCGGFTRATWPMVPRFGSVCARDSSQSSFVFLLSPRVERFDLWDSGWASTVGAAYFSVGSVLYVRSDGRCQDWPAYLVGGPGTSGVLTGAREDAAFERFELWQL
jgi:hypothetical protein